MNQLNGLISQVLVNIVVQLFTVVCILIALFSINARISLLAFVLMGLQFINFTYFRRKIRQE